MSTATAEHLTTPALRALPGLRHGFFTRRGGVSEGPYASLNCSLSGQDDHERVRENRRRAADALGLPATALHGLTQVHGTAVAEVDAAGWLEGAGPAADAVVTRRPGVALGIVTGDCAPVLFADAEAGVVGAAHAGWRGAAAGVLEETVAAMERLGASRARIVASVGPCIAQASYEVGPDLRDAVLAGGAVHPAPSSAPGERGIGPAPRDAAPAGDTAGAASSSAPGRRGIGAGWRDAAPAGDAVHPAPFSAPGGRGIGPASRAAALLGAPGGRGIGTDPRGAALPLDAASFFAPGRREDRWQFDLAGYCAARLRALGLLAVEGAGADTLSDEARFFSHRRRTLAGGGPLGHQLSAIALAA